MQQPFEIAGISVNPGQCTVVNVELPGLHSKTSVNMPVHVIHGKQAGPVLFISSAVHGDEINGVEAVRRLLTLKSIRKLRGTLLIVPVVNVFGFDAHSRYLPDRRDLNRCFPGREEGTLASRLAHLFMSEVVCRSSYGIDLHTAAIHRDNLPQIRADLKFRELNELARDFQAPVLLHSAPPEGSLRHAAAQENVSVMVYEAGEALRFDEISIRVAVRGILNVMRVLGMLRKSKTQRGKPSVLLRSSSWIRASRSGILRAQVGLGDMIKKGDVLGSISDPGSDQDEVIEAANDGIVIGRTNIPLVYEGDALFHIGRSRQSELLEEHIDTLHDEELLATPELVEEPVIV